MNHANQTKSQESSHHYRDLAEFKIVFIICIGILAMYSTLSPSTQVNYVNSKPVSVSTDTNSEVTGFIKHQGAAEFTAINTVPEWAKSTN